MNKQEWKYNGSVWDFIDMVKWSVVAQYLVRKERDDVVDILRNPEDIKKFAEQMGITDRAMADELRRIGEKAERLFLDFDKAEGKKIVERPELFQSHRKPRNMQEVLWIIDSRDE